MQNRQDSGSTDRWCPAAGGGFIFQDPPCNEPGDG